MVDFAKDALVSFNSNTAPVWLFQYTILGPKIPESPEINTRTEPEPKKEPDPESGNPYWAIFRRADRLGKSRRMGNGPAALSQTGLFEA